MHIQAPHFSPTALKPWQANLLALLSGAMIPLALAPFNIWPLAIIGPALVAWLLQGLNGRQAMWRSWVAGFGLFAVGASWVYVSIHEFGAAPVWLATLLTTLFAAGLALAFCLPFYAYGRWFSRLPLALPLAFPAIWLLGEWLRSWFLTGFPWLFIGYSQLDTWLAGWAPVSGVFGISLILTLTAGALAHCISSRKPYALLLPAILWLGGLALQSQHWTKSTGETISIGLVQPNIAQGLKWQADFLEPTLQLYRDLSEPLWQQDLVIWPEAAIPLTYHRAKPFLEEMHYRALASNSGLITGLLYDDRRKGEIYNSLYGLGTATGLYHKRRLVPFGEYVPFEDWLRGTIDFFNLPTSIIRPGPEQQYGLQSGNMRLTPALCYEVVYPDLVAASAREADVLLTVSNDAWFGDSLGPLQHMQMAQMRALENGRYMIRGTNNGISGIINPRGEVEAVTEQFVATTLTGNVTAYRGHTPFMRWLSTPVIVLCAALLLVTLLRRKAGCGQGDAVGSARP